MKARITVDVINPLDAFDAFTKFCSSHYACGGCKYYNPARDSKLKDCSCEILFYNDRYFFMPKKVGGKD